MKPLSTSAYRSVLIKFWSKKKTKRENHEYRAIFLEPVLSFKNIVFTDCRINHSLSIYITLVFDIWEFYLEQESVKSHDSIFCLAYGKQSGDNKIRRATNSSVFAKFFCCFLAIDKINVSHIW